MSLDKSAAMRIIHRKVSKKNAEDLMYKNNVRAELESLADSVFRGHEVLVTLEDGNEERKAALCCELQCFYNSVINENEKQFFILSCLYYDNIALLCFCEPDLKVSIKSQEKEFSILEIAVKMNAINVVEELLKGLQEQELQWGTTHKTIESSLIVIIEADNVRMLEIFKKYGFVSTIKLYGGQSLIHIAVQSFSEECLRLLTSENFNLDMLNMKGLTPLVEAARVGNIQAVKHLLHCDCNKYSQDECGRTVLHIATNFGLVEMVQEILETNFDLDIADHKKLTPLLIACGRGHHQIASILIQKGANINFCELYSPLHLAARGGHKKTISLLLQSGACLGSTDMFHETALDSLVKYSPESVSELKSVLDKCIFIGEGYNNDEQVILDFRPLFYAGDMRETSVILALVNLNQYELLSHPLCEAYIQLKWKSIPSWIMYSFVVVYVIYLLLLFILIDIRFVTQVPISEPIAGERVKIEKKAKTGLILSDNLTELNLDNVEFLVNVLLFLFTLTFLITEILQFVGDSYNYIRDFSNYLSMVTIALTLGICFTESSTVNTIYLASFTVLLASWEMLFVIAYIPGIGIYIQMFFKAVRNLLFFTLSFLSLISGFGLSLAVIFRTVQFSKFPFYFLTSYVMMGGDLDYKTLLFEEGDNHNKRQDDPTIYALFIILIAFILMVVVTLSNLLVGLAVSDTQDIYASAVAYHTAMRIRRLHVIEQALVYSRFYWLEQFKKKVFRKYLLFNDIPLVHNFCVDLQDKKWRKNVLSKDLHKRLRMQKKNYMVKLEKDRRNHGESETNEILKLLKDLYSKIEHKDT
ncbi:transient receptor potential channel pyrexia-like [Artemia franciscana]|uniref:Ion transport domain-containing protein n=1 Tax=Artemia franciscana TaxID=6661 RepID=A0AA88LES5_ARTSF|nr:hypothetical protein QYM36_002554 [Artemia franciscana]